MRSLIRSLGISSCSDSPYSCITFQLQSSAQICHRMVSSTAFRTKAQVVSHSRCSNTQFLCCSFYIRNWSNNHEHWWHDWLGRWRCHRRSCCGGGKAISLTTHPPYHSCRLRWKRFLPSCSWATAISEFTICRLQKMQTVCRLWRLYDWETGCIVPAILSDPLMAVEVDLVTNEDASPSFIRAADYATPTDLEKYTLWAEQYLQCLPVQIFIFLGSTFPSSYSLFSTERSIIN